MEIIRQSNIVRTSWSGGETQQLVILPKNADFLRRDFDLRISSASVTTEVSEFTKFPGYNRVLIPLRGNLNLLHKTPSGEMQQQLEPWQIGAFSGEWETTSTGIAEDFNVIYSKEYHPKIQLLHITGKLLIHTASKYKVITVIEGELAFGQETLFSMESLILHSNDDSIIVESTHCMCIVVEF
jgi:environmental stress-induced protein Ves